MKRLSPFLFLLFLSGCNHAVDKAHLPGAYSFKENGIEQKVEIDSDGEYVNSLFTNGVLSWSETGQWAYDTESNERGITFSKFRFGLPNTSTVQGFWFVVPTQPILGKRQLCFDVDLNRCFEAS
jgi:hypothetical protein